MKKPIMQKPKINIKNQPSTFSKKDQMIAYSNLKFDPFQY